MDTVEYDFSRIVNISCTGLTYVDDLGNHCFINFSDCRRNWVNHVNTTNAYSRNDLSKKDTKCVGERDICPNPKYFTFYCNPKVKFVFQCKDNFVVRLFRFQSKSSRNFLKIQFSINSVGWSTFDLS